MFAFVYHRQQILALSTRFILSTIICLLTFGTNAATLPGDIPALMKRYKVASDDIAIDVRRVKDNQVIMSHNGKSARNPASTIKVLTTAAALDILGPNYYWQTQYLADGTIQGDTLKGNLVIKGEGDPFVSIERLWQHIYEIQLTGIRNITGKIILDNSHFQLTTHDRFAFDGAGHRLYNVGPSATLNNFSATEIRISPQNSRIKVTAVPQFDNLIIVNQLKAQKGKCTSRDSGWKQRIEEKNGNVIVTLTGNYRSSCKDHIIRRALFDNATYTYEMFKHLWRQSGGKGITGFSIQPTPNGSELILQRDSAPLLDIVKGINKFSNNVMSQQLLLSLVTSKKTPASFAAARARIQSWLKSQHIAMPRLYLDNGSGLSRTVRVSAQGMGNLLQYIWHSPYRPELLASLPLTGIDGTMRKRLKKTGLAENARIKTGYLRNTRAMAGYMRAENGCDYSVVMFVSAKTVDFSVGNAFQDALLKWLYHNAPDKKCP